MHSAPQIESDDVTGNQQCRYCHFCDVQTGINWQAVFLCAFDPDAIVSVEHDHSCAAFVREPGSDDDV